jgi:hypothetical protein
MADLPTVLHLPIAVFHCTAPPNILSPEQAVYVKMFSDSTRNRPYPSWGTFVASAGENTVIFADMNHGDRSVPISSPFFAHKGIGVRLDGQVFTQTRIGNWNDPVWWQSP